jgi:hypothetical protein
MQVYLLDAKLVDARRPKTVKLTNSQKEERLLPYHPQVCLPQECETCVEVIIWLSATSLSEAVVSGKLVN